MNGLRVVPVAFLVVDEDTEVVLKDDEKVPHNVNFEVREELSLTVNVKFLCDDLLEMMQEAVVEGAHSCWTLVSGAVTGSAKEHVDLISPDPGVVILEVELTIPGHTAALPDRSHQADDGVSLDDVADHLVGQTPQAAVLVRGQAPQMVLELSAGAYMGKDGTFGQHVQDINDEGLDDKLCGSLHGLLTVITILGGVSVWVWEVVEESLVDLVVFHVGLDPKVQFVDSGMGSLQGP